MTADRGSLQVCGQSEYVILVTKLSLQFQHYRYNYKIIAAVHFVGYIQSPEHLHALSADPSRGPSWTQIPYLVGWAPTFLPDLA